MSRAKRCSNAAFFGWLPADVRQIEADILAFADIDDFIDAPTKVYSSGMVALGIQHCDPHLA